MIKYLASTLYFYLFRAIGRLKHAIQREKLQTEVSVRVTALDPMMIPKYKNQLIKPPVYKPIKIEHKIVTKGVDNKLCKKREKGHLYFVDISEFKQQVLPEGFPKTTVWGYGGIVKDEKTGRIMYSRSAPGATFEATRGVPVMVKWINRLTGSHLFAVDPTLHWANPNHVPMEPDKPWPPFPPGFPEAQSPIPIVTHLHGGETPSAYDGHPDAWFTYNGKKGSAFVTTLYSYPNAQEPATLWYHDHALGITRLNVYAGLAGFYLLRDSNNCKDEDCCRKKLVLPEGAYEIPLAIQDRSFNTDGSLSFPTEGNNLDIHPYWRPEFFGNTIMVNGKVWPNLNVERRQYRFRLLNGSNARFYNLRLSKNGMKFIQIGTDGGFLPEPVELDSLLIAPGERADVLVDFSDIAPGISILLMNDAKAPFPVGDDPDPNTVGQIMQFTVPLNSPAPAKPPKLPLNSPAPAKPPKLPLDSPAPAKPSKHPLKSPAPVKPSKLPLNSPAPVKPSKLPKKLNNIPDLVPEVQRILTLNEVMGPNDSPVMLLLNGQKWEAPVSELPRVGSTEEWVIANLTMDTHPIHLHLVQYQLLNRQDFRADDYRAKWEELNGMPPLDHPTKVLPVEPYLIGVPIEPDANEKGWKDTVRMNPNQVTRILVRFAPQNVAAGVAKPGKNFYPFNPSCGPGYVWHCHILDHEDNEMMRPYRVKS